jgi:hypothetical protein
MSDTVQNGYRATLVEQVQKYAAALPAGEADSLRTLLTVGELSLAAADLVSALVRGGVPVDPQDVPTLRWLLDSVTLPPDTPADLVDRLTVA